MTGSCGTHPWEQGPYLSPYFSPLLKIGIWPLSSAILVAWIPLGFRATCYYYRKAYYRAFFWDPPACAVAEGRHRKYTGERRLPWILNNLHRFFLYLALVILVVLWYDTINAFHYRNGLYIGIGSAIMLLNVVLLTMYTFSCHALRHFVGGNVDCFSCVRGGQARRGLWGLVTRVNPFHGNFAWASLISVACVDIYIRLVSSGAFGSCFGAHTGC
ncbi:MAG: succinate dehydrogenase [Chloroflexi bacterium]|nr:MAG: succinate dehydrogenase [Chloroflexota bacterium]